MLTAANNYGAQLGQAWRCSELFSAASSPLGGTHSTDEETGSPSEEEAASSARVIPTPDPTSLDRRRRQTPSSSWAHHRGPGAPRRSLVASWRSWP